MEPNRISELGGWFEQEADALVLYARQWLDPHAAEDVVQDAFIDLMNCRRQPDHPKPWLYQAVRFRALKSLRTGQRRSRREALAAGEAEPCLEGTAAQALDAREAGLALAGLDPGEREVITLRIWGGLKLEEIAAITETSVATVFRRYRDGLAELRNLLEPPTSCPTCPH
ncbi:MAG: RNA polymerase sigma factor [Verrucomicrobiales bacterium]|nr:RNA polymerase sigma factor [Verrucomicrobiales bacterium]